MPPAKKTKGKTKAAAPAKPTMGGFVDESEDEDDLSNMNVIRSSSVKSGAKKPSTKTTKKEHIAQLAIEEEEEGEEEKEEPVAKPQPKMRGRPAGTSYVASTSSGGANKVKKATIKPSRPLGARAKKTIEDSLDEDSQVENVKVMKKKDKTVIPESVGEEEEEEEEQALPSKKRGRIAKAAPKNTTSRKLAQPESEESTAMEDTQEIGEDATEVTAPPTPPLASGTVPASERSKKRPAPTDDEVNNGGAVLRRKLAEMNRKFEKLEAKYNELKEIGVKEAENNYEKLRKQTEDRVKTSSELVAKLQEEVKVQAQLAQEGEVAKAELEESDSTIKEFETKIIALEKSLTDSRAENKNLANKLAVSRNGDISISGTAAKGARNGALGGPGRTLAANNELVVAAQMKEDLYGDLTGLLIRGVKRNDTEEVFDCLQTGRNGTLHFKLAIEQEEGSNGQYEEATFTYKPQLDDNRDADLIDLLPDYLTEEITFPRPHAAKFYARVSKALTGVVDR